MGVHSLSYGVSLQIEEEVVLRVEDSNNLAKSVGILPKGSIVDIPDEYIVKDSSGQMNIDFTLNKWLQDGSKDFIRNDIRIPHTPITIIHPQLDLNLSDQTLYISLKALKLKEVQSTFLNVIEDSEVLSVIESSKNETEAGSICTGVCALQDEVLDSNTQDFILRMRELSENVVSRDLILKSQRKFDILRVAARQLDRNLQESCGLSKEELCSELENTIEQHALPFKCDELMSLLLIESSGRCRAVNENSSSTDIGLFQINTINFQEDIDSGQAKHCTSSEFNRLKDMAKQSGNAIRFWKEQPQPQCLSNPMYSLKKAGEVLELNKRLFKNRIPRITSEEHQNLYKRMILSGYNGGGGHALRALTDLEIFNTDLQKTLSEGGKDITRSNRGILRIKQEIEVIDNGLTQVNQSMESINSQISENQEGLERIRNFISLQERIMSRQEEQISRNTSDGNQELLSRQNTNLSQQLHSQTEEQIRTAESLVQQYNLLNKIDISLLSQQAEVLEFLDQRFKDITDQRRISDPEGQRGEALSVISKALEEFIQEIEEEKKPHYLTQIELRDEGLLISGKPRNLNEEKIVTDYLSNVFKSPYRDADYLKFMRNYDRYLHRSFKRQLRRHALGLLNQKLEDITNQRRNVRGQREKDRELSVIIYSLEEMIQEMEEGKWPYRHLRRIDSKNEERSENSDTQQNSGPSKEDEIIMSYLSAILKGSYRDSNILSILRNYQDRKESADHQRQQLEANDIFQDIRPFLIEIKGPRGIKDFRLPNNFEEFYRHRRWIKNSTSNSLNQISDRLLNDTKIEGLKSLMEQIQADLNEYNEAQQNMKEQLFILSLRKIEKTDQQSLLETQIESAKADLATSQKDPYSWEDLKLFYFSAELKEGIQNSGLRSTRSFVNATTNVTYVDTLLGKNQNEEGFADSSVGRDLCPQ